MQVMSKEEMNHFHFLSSKNLQGKEIFRTTSTRYILMLSMIDIPRTTLYHISYSFIRYYISYFQTMKIMITTKHINKRESMKYGHL